MPSSPLPKSMIVRCGLLHLSASRDGGNCRRICSMCSLAATNRSFKGPSRFTSDVPAACSSRLTARLPSARERKQKLQYVGAYIDEAP